jgi:3-oxoacyl-[acyl-carrier protein] reductase
MFEGKVAVVTGAGRGIGRAVAQLLTGGGARVVIGDVDPDATERTVAELGAQTAVGHVADLTKAGAPEALVARAVDAWGRLDIVVNNAGYTADRPLHKLSDDDFQAMLDIHTLVPFRVLRAAAPHLREPAKQERADGREVFRKVVNVSSIAAYGNAGQANYASAKAGVIGLTRTLAKEWGPLKINVNAVAFGFIDTRLTAARGDDAVVRIGERTAAVGVPADVRAHLGSLIPLGRAGSAEEAAGAIAFLCSPWSDYVTGQVLNVSGGVPFGMAA